MCLPSGSGKQKSGDNTKLNCGALVIFRMFPLTVDFGQALWTWEWQGNTGLRFRVIKLV